MASDFVFYPLVGVVALPEFQGRLSLHPQLPRDQTYVVL